MARSAEHAVTKESTTTVFTSGEDGYHSYRIPTIVQGNNGYLYAFAEGRTNSLADQGDNDIVMKYSADNGATWSSMSVIRDIGTRTVGNPCPVVDSDSGNISLLHNVDRLSIYSTTATVNADGSLNWSQSDLVSTSALGNVWRILTGPVHGIQLTRGENAGRMVVGSSFRDMADGYGNCVFYSDDSGATWQIGAIDGHTLSDSVHPNENVGVELTDGRLYFNARDHLGSSVETRAIAYSSDGGESYDAPFVSYSAIDTPVVQNSIIRFAATDQGDAENILVYSAPHSTDDSRVDTIPFMFS